MNKDSLRSIPSVEKVLQSLEPISLPRPVIVQIVRRELQRVRRSGDTPCFEEILSTIDQALHRHYRTRLQPVINGTGVLIHTNLGRAPLGSSVVETIREVAMSYNNLEFDVESGQRGGRASYVEHHLALLCQAEAATVVNNCAAALVLILQHFTSRKPEVIISRGELIQIGGGFRIPEILESSGARLKEIGTTNKTSIEDYARALSPQTGLILKVHRSNFFMRGFVESPATAEIADLARLKKIPFVEDLGSGAVWPTERLGPLPHEPMPGEILKHGVPLVCFSGDKLMGGPQAGIIVGRARWVARLKKEPFFRALRCDKLILGALQATVDQYLSLPSSAPWPEDTIEVPPIHSMIASTEEVLAKRAESILSQLASLGARSRLRPTITQVGGGTLPQAELSSLAICLKPQGITASELATRLRHGSPPMIGYLAGGEFRLDLRTVLPHQDLTLVRRLRETLGRPHGETTPRPHSLS